MMAVDVIAQAIRCAGAERGAGILGEDIVEALDAAGYVIVPKEPTQQALDALYGYMGEHDGSDAPARKMYCAVVSAGAHQWP